MIATGGECFKSIHSQSLIKTNHKTCKIKESFLSSIKSSQIMLFFNFLCFLDNKLICIYAIYVLNENTYIKLM